MTRNYRCSGSIQSILGAAALLVLLAPTAGAQDYSQVAVDDGEEIVRDALTLADEIRPRPTDTDVADTVLTFTNLGNTDARVRCVAFDKNGNRVGRRWLKVPALGLRYALASDLSNDRDFVGHAQCAAPGTIKGSALFLGPDLTDLPVMNPWGRGRIRFPLVATY